MLRGNLPAKIDEKGRLKVPSAFLAYIEESYGTDLFVTSLTGDSVHVYPMPVWEDIERKLAAAPSTLPAVRKFSDRVNYFGQTAVLDKQGRVVIQARLRETAGMVGDVDVLGKGKYIEVWNHERCASRVLAEQLTEEDQLALSQYGI